MITLFVTDRAKVRTKVGPATKPGPFFYTTSLSFLVIQKGHQTGLPRRWGDPGSCP